MNPFVRKLENFVRLSSSDCAVLRQVANERTRNVAPRVDIAREDDNPRDMHLVLSGWACRYKELEDGRRQIVSFFLPGDICDFNTFILRELDHSIAAITPVTIAELSQDFVEMVSTKYPRILAAMWWETLVNGAIQREWTLNIGQRTALERTAHLLCELMVRMRCVGQTEADSCPFPLTQSDLAEATGLSKVHVNRVLQEMRASDLIVLKGKRLVVPDMQRLMRVALFNPNYLHMDHEGRHLDANE